MKIWGFKWSNPEASFRPCTKESIDTIFNMGYAPPPLIQLPAFFLVGFGFLPEGRIRIWFYLVSRIRIQVNFQP